MVPPEKIIDLCNMAKHIVCQLSPIRRNPTTQKTLNQNMNLNTLSSRVGHDHVKTISSELGYDRN